ncbi:MAG: glucosamine-6-phosphate deaminase [Cyclobacteriaceae bacterium]|nr:glucosamine-6-phosphate deaminase [Cyclobacteriaceae bacterium]
MTIQIFPDYATLSKATAELIIEYIHKKPNSLICLASGHTPIGVFDALKKATKSHEVDLSKCTFISLDEWIGIDPQDSGSCLSMLQKDFFIPLDIRTNQIEFFRVNTNDLQKECDRINLMIEQNGGLDVMLVGVGTNGHIGMNEPGTSFESYAHISKLAEETKQVGQKYFERETALSTGITLGLKHLREAKLPIVMASGKKKATIIAKGLKTIATEEIPLSAVNLITEAYVMLDQDAASLLEA